MPTGLEVSGKTAALVGEIAALLDALLASGEGGSIDLRRLPLLPDELSSLWAFLGSGEVRAEVAALGPTRIVETGLPGVWRVTHFDADEAVVADFVEVAFCPEILKSPAGDVRAGRQELLARLRGEFPDHLGEDHDA